MRTIVAALIINLAVVSLASEQTPVASSCKPTFAPAEYSRGVPWTFVDQGLVSIPRLYPKHVLLATRRADQLGPVTFSLLVYREDAARPDTTIEGMAVEGETDNPKAWRFSARCSAESLAEGLVTTLEEITKLKSH